MSSGRESSVEVVELLAVDGTDVVLPVVVDVVAVVVVVVAVVVLLPPLRLVAEGAGLNDEEAELTGDGSIEEAESMQRAESMELIEPSRLLAVLPDWVCALIQGCCRHSSAVSRWLRREQRRENEEGRR